jgi:hypothetical protein
VFKFARLLAIAESACELLFNPERGMENEGI